MSDVTDKMVDSRMEHSELCMLEFENFSLGKFEVIG